MVLAGVDDAAVGAAAVPDQPPGGAAVDVLAEAVVQQLALEADLGQLVGLGPAEIAPEDQPAGHPASVARASAATSLGRIDHHIGGRFGPRRGRGSFRGP